jgi:exopolysaccharide biosynthesis polyprenyl glycosylphosphotransferase
MTTTNGLRRKIPLEVLKSLDLLIMCCAFFLGTMAEYHQSGEMPLQSFLSMRISLQNLLLFMGFSYSWPTIFSSLLLYRSRRLINRWVEVADCLKATSLGTLVMLLSSLVFHLYLITPLFLVVFFVTSTTLTILSRLMIRYGLEYARRKGRNIRSMLIVGTNPRALRFASEIEHKPDLGYRVLGFVDDDWSGMRQFRKSDYPLKGNFKDVPKILREQVIDEVVISLPMYSLYEQASAIVGLCQEQGIVVRFLSDLFTSKPAPGKQEWFEDDSLITIYPGAILGWPALLKRLLDFSLSLTLIIVLSPLLAFTALLIKLTSHGPALFIQERVGLNKRRFRLYKFRTMAVDAEKQQARLEHLNEVSGPAFKIKNDPRITNIGKLLRKTSLDELPQLVNVLKGDMSLVGPRPLPVRDYNGFSQDWQRRRFSVLPGLTCLWQINGRSNVDFNKWMKLDLQYIDQWSLWLDLKILIMTIPAVLRGSGAV